MNLLDDFHEAILETYLLIAVVVLLVWMCAFLGRIADAINKLHMEIIKIDNRRRFGPDPSPLEVERFDEDMKEIEKMYGTKAPPQV